MKKIASSKYTVQGFYKTLKNSIFPKKGYKTILVIANLIFGTFAYGQVTIVGVSSATVGDRTSFSLSSSAGTDTQWFLGPGSGQATIVGSNNNAARIEFTGSGTVVVSATVLDDTVVLYQLTKNVSVSGGVPDTPGNPTVLSNTCSAPVLQRTGFSSGTGDTWYWQGKTSNGTHTNKGSGSTYTANEGSGTYYIRARSSTGEWSPSSGSVTVTVNSLQAGAISGNQTICYGTDPSTLSSSSAATYGDSYSYQWQVSTNNSTWNNISGATGTSYNPSANLTSDRWYRRRVTSCGGQTLYTSSVKVTVRDPLDAGTLNPVITICHNGNPPNLTSAISPSNGSGYSYQWEISTNGSSWSPINGATLSTYDPPSGLTVPTWYRKVVTSCGQTDETPGILVDVYDPLSAGDIQGNQTLCHGQNPGTISNLTSPSGGKNTYVYSWQSSPDGQAPWTTINGATLPDYTPDPNATATMYYRRGVNSCNFILYSDSSVMVEVVPQLQVPTGSLSIGTCFGEMAELQLTPDPNANTIRWYTAQTGGTHIAQSTSYTTGDITFDTSYYASSYDSVNQCESSTRVKVDVNVISEVIYYLDADGDGISAGEVTGCTNPDPSIYVTAASIQNSGDCDDSDPNVRAEQTWYLDADGDRYYASFILSCTDPGGDYKNSGMLFPGDCDDNSYDPDNDCGGSSSSGAQANNYVYSRTYQKSKSEMLAAGEDQNLFNFFTASESVIQEITYFDGVGRPYQQIGLEQTPAAGSTKRDVVTHIEYDGFGRSEKEWLPFAADIGTFGAIKTGTAQANLDYYNVAKYDLTTNPYSQKKLEESTLSRVLQQAAPGTDWALGNGHEIDFAYQTNTHDPTNVSDTNNDNVRLYTVSLAFANDTYAPTLVNDGYYGAGELRKNITYDENHTTGHDHSVEEFTDKLGRVVLKRTYNNDEEHDTYYVYDDFGNLTYVIPPLVNTAAAIDNTVLENLCYQYVYDHRNRLVEKQLPGKEREYIVYNKLDQPIMTQDAVQRASGEWLFTKYDAFGRGAYTGKAVEMNGANAATRAEVQSNADSASGDLWVERGTGFSMDNMTVEYGNTAYPTTTVSEVLTINYYDDHTFNTADEPAPPADIFGVSLDSRTTGLATGSKVKVLDPDATAGQETWITTITRYDAKGRPLYTYSENDFLQTTDIVETQLDFVGRPLKVRSEHTRSGNTVVTIDNFEYDHVGRLLKQTQCIGDATLGYDCTGSTVEPNLVLENETINSDREAPNSVTIWPTTTLIGNLTVRTNPALGGSGGELELIVYNQYDELGQLEAKKVGGAPNTTYALTTGLQTVDYTYNVRGWLKSINQDAYADNDLFNFGINYNTVAHGGTPLFNGNIAETQWETANDNIQRWYHYGYDALNRITGATSYNGDYNVSNITYDLNGNIQTLQRQGHTGPIDNLTYNYHSTGASNRLQRVADASGSAEGFVDGDTSATEYTYDANGNMIADTNKGINTIVYNHLNLPTNVSLNSGTITYIYDAAGTKLRKTAGSSVTDYAGNYVYTDNAGTPSLEFLSHPEGYITPSGVPGSYDYVYQYEDHLGNIRLSFVDNNGTLEIIEENNYYPFGLKHKGYNSGSSPLGNDVAQRWKFGGKELDNSLNDALATYDFGARNYDPALGRWFGVDELAENYNNSSPYAFVANNPMTNLEIDGRFWIRTVDDNGNVTYTAEEGDSAQSLYEQFGEQDGFDAEIADYMIQNLFGENRVENGKEFSNIDPEDSFTLFSEDTSEVIDGDHRIQVVDNDSEVEETDLSTVDMGGTQIDQNTLEKRDNRKALVIMAEGFHPKNKIPEFGLKGLKMWGGRKTGKSSFGSKFDGRGTTSPSSRVNTELKIPVPINSTRAVPVRGHFRTLKSGKKVWVRPHIRNIKTSSN